MRTALALLVGFFFSAVCPVAMSAEMDMESNHMMMQGMSRQTQQNAVPCEQCDNEHEQLAAFLREPEENAVADVAHPIFTTCTHNSLITHHTELSAMLHAPPHPPDSLVGTVIMRN